MESTSHSAADLTPHSRDLNEPKTVRAILGFVGALLLGSVVGGVVVVIVAGGIFAVALRKPKDETGSTMESTGNEMKVERIVVWVATGFSLVSLAWAGKIALAYRRRLQEVVGPPGA